MKLVRRTAAISSFILQLVNAQDSSSDGPTGADVIDFFKVGELGQGYSNSGDPIVVCRDEYSRPNPYATRQLTKFYRRKADDKDADPLDRLMCKMIEYGVEQSNCMLDTHLANHNVEADSDSARMRSVVDWNCHDDECDIPVTLKGIWNYGCWCNFGGDLLQGKGQPVNPHDKVCQDMQLCLRCAEMDGKSDGYSCDAKTQDYSSLLELGVAGMTDNSQSINSGCASINQDNLCATHVCTCEVEMINALLALVWSGYTHDISPRHPDNPYGGVFDWESQCNTDPTGTIVKECCGKYPFRFPYNSLNKDCCENGGVYATYNALDQVCCADGVKKVSDGGC